VSIFALNVSIAMGLALVIDYRLLIISRARGRVWTTAGVCRANVSPFACFRDSKNPVPTGRYGRDGDAVW
jgi:uncharacterized membrane protein YdfJ with MMPL/SSD domain